MTVCSACGYRCSTILIFIALKRTKGCMMMLEGSAAEDSFFHMQNRKPVASHIFHTTAAWLAHVVERQNAVREVVDLRP